MTDSLARFEAIAELRSAGISLTPDDQDRLIVCARAVIAGLTEERDAIREEEAALRDEFEAYADCSVPITWHYSAIAERDAARREVAALSGGKLAVKLVGVLTDPRTEPTETPT